MAWTSPITVTDGDTLTAAWGNSVRDALNYLKGVSEAPTIDDDLTVSGTVTATGFSGSGATLTNLNPANFSSTLPATKHPAAPAARVRHSTNWALATSWTAHPFDTEVYDTDTIHDTGDNTKLTCKTAGYYLVWGSILVSNPQQSIGLRIRHRDGGSLDNVVAIGQGGTTPSTWDVAVGVAGVIAMTVNTYVQLETSIGSTKDSIANDEYSPLFGMIWIAP